VGGVVSQKPWKAKGWGQTIIKRRGPRHTLPTSLRRIIFFFFLTPRTTAAPPLEQLQSLSLHQSPDLLNGTQEESQWLE
jgi:hypothetical protein